MKKNNYTFEVVSNSNLDDLPSLFQASFNKTCDLQYFINKFDIKNSKFGYIAHIVRDENFNAVGYYGLYPIRIVVDKKIIFSCQSGDTMTHPGHVGRGLFTKCAAVTYSLAYKNNITSVFGFPSNTSFKGFVKLGWIFPHVILRKRLLVPTLPLILLYRNFSLLKYFHKKYCSYILSKLPAGKPFPGNLSDFDCDYVLHDFEFWEYKLRGSSNYLINILGVDYFIKFDEGKIIIGDFCARNLFINAISQILLRMIAIILMIPVIDYYASPNNPNLSRIYTIGGTKEALPFGFMSFDNSVDLSKLCFTSMDFDTF